MILVLIFLGVIILVALVIVTILLSTIQIQVKDLEIGNVNKEKSNIIEEKKNNYKIKLYVKIFGRFTIYKNLINKEKLEKVYNSKIIKKFHIDKNLKSELKKEMKFRKKELVDLIKKVHIEILELNLKIWIGIEDAVLTSFAVAGLASIISIILPFLIEQKNIKKCQYFVNPIYVQKNLYNIKLESIIQVKMVHIIYIIYILTMKGRDKNERASDRRSYDYSNGFN